MAVSQGLTIWARRRRACAHVRTNGGGAVTTGSGGRVTGPAPGEDLGPADADIADPDTYTAGVPHATFQRLRRDDPVSWWGEDHAGGHGFWAVTRHADLLTVSRDVDRFSSASGIRLEEMDAEETEARRTMMELDPPAHTAYRRLVSKPFSRREVYAYENAIRLLARAVVEEALASESRFDFVDRIAKQLPMRMLGRLLGVPDDDGPWLVERGDALLGNTDPEFTTHPVDLVDTEEFRLLPFRSPVGVELFRYAQEQARSRRDNPTDDVISDLLQPKVDGETLSEHEFNNFFTLLVAAGNDTTRYTMTAGIKALIERPDQMAELRDAIVAGDGDVIDVGGRGGAPLGVGDDALPPHRGERHDARRARDQGRRQGGDLVRVGRLRRGRVRRSVHVRHPPVAQPPGRVRVDEPAPLPRRPARPDGDQGAVRGAAAAPRRHRHRRPHRPPAQQFHRRHQTPPRACDARSRVGSESGSYRCVEHDGRSPTARSRRDGLMTVRRSVQDCLLTDGRVFRTIVRTLRPT